MFKYKLIISLILLSCEFISGQEYVGKTPSINSETYEVKTENHVGFGLGYYTNKSVDVETYFYFGAPYIILGLNTSDGYGKIAIGRQFNLKFAGSIGITKNLETSSGYYFETAIMYRIYKPIHLSAGLNSKFGIRLGINYII